MALENLSDPATRSRLLLRLGIVVTLGLLTLRISLARSTGFGDSEALYASYALYPQPAYLDHPGLIGLVGRLLGRADAPDPFRAHLFSTTLAALVPWLGALAARLGGATGAKALGTALALSLVPELAVGLYGFTPDLLLCFGWIGALVAVGAALRQEPKSFWALVWTLVAGLMVGLATLSKVTGALLGLALLVALFGSKDARRRRSVAPWAAIALGCVLVLPVVVWEVEQGWPMLRHRLVTTQAEAGLSLRNLGALVGGQLVYLSPWFAWGAWLLLRDLWRRRKEDDFCRVLWLATVIPGVPLVGLCLWSRVAEPHWLAPALLPLALHLGRSEVISARLGRWALASGAVLIGLVFVLAKTPLSTHLPGDLYQPRYDLTNDLHAWGPGRRLLEDSVEAAMGDTHELPVIVGPHWTVCAQAQAAVGHRVPVGCNGPVRDDFDRWLPRSRWLAARTVLYVHDDRFAVDPGHELPQRQVTAVSKVGIRRGGRLIRTIHIARLEKTSEVALGR
jgi:hypothetical protein